MEGVKVVASEALQEVRFKVLWPHLSSAEEAVIDIDKSDGAVHLASYQDGEVVGVASLFAQQCERYPNVFPKKNAFRLRAMGVLDSVRGSGVGAQIINRAVELLKEKGVEVLWCDAREVAWGFYLKQGFKFAEDCDGYECEAYVVRNVGLHKMMYFYIT